MNSNHLLKKIDNLSTITPKILCIGDLILDSFNQGIVKKISPEKPVPVFYPTSIDYKPGGAANVATNIASLGCSCKILGIIGNDRDGMILQEALFQNVNIENWVIADSHHCTTHKKRYVSDGHHLLRVDNEKISITSIQKTKQLLEVIPSAIEDCGAVVISDYAKGVLTDDVIKAVIRNASSRQIPIIVDPKSRNLSRYDGATIITPNAVEAEASTGIHVVDDNSAENAGNAILRMCSIEHVLITRSSDGMSLISKIHEPVHIRCHPIEVYDVVGAGDTVVAALSCFLAHNLSLIDTVYLANIAACISVGKKNLGQVSLSEISSFLAVPSTNSMNKIEEYSPILTIKDLPSYVSELKTKRLRIGFTNGVFDILHAGHLSLLNFAKSNCDILIVGINSDKSVKSLNKGLDRPINGVLDRARILSGLKPVDAVVIFEDETPISVINAIKPDILVKGADYNINNIVGSKEVFDYGGKVILAPLIEGKSTSRIIDQIRGI